jgi:hypothetical protein
MEAPSMMNALVAEHGGRVIAEMRSSDGYVNATLMCKTGGKEWKQYRRNDTTQAFLEALTDVVGVPVDELVKSKVGGDHSGTWVHPTVATHLAAWISPLFFAKVTVWLETAKASISAIAAEYEHEINNLTPNPSDQAEHCIRDRLVVELDGTAEVPAKYGPIDVVTPEEVIEVKRAPMFTRALGQVLGHSFTFPHLRRRIHLFGTAEECSDQVIQDATALCKLYDVILSFEIIDCDTVPTSRWKQH